MTHSIFSGASMRNTSFATPLLSRLELHARNMPGIEKLGRRSFGFDFLFFLRVRYVFAVTANPTYTLTGVQF